MTDPSAHSHRGRMLRYSFGAAFGLLAVASALTGTPWFVVVVLFCAAIAPPLGSGRRIFRAAVRRSGDEIVCRYLPLYEVHMYVFGILVPGVGAAFIAAGYAPGYPAWLRLGGVVLLCVSALLVASFVQMWHRCFLSITPSVLRFRAAVGPLTEVRRDLVRAIEPKVFTNGMGNQSLQVEIEYWVAGMGDTNKTVRLGPQLSVQPVNLLNGLRAWKDGRDAESGELLDRVEGILRGRATAGS